MGKNYFREFAKTAWLMAETAFLPCLLVILAFTCSFGIDNFNSPEPSRPADSLYRKDGKLYWRMNGKTILIKDYQSFKKDTTCQQTTTTK